MSHHSYSTKDCSVDLPYPEPKAECRNIYYARILMDDYSGFISEFSAVSLYSYQHFSAEYTKYESYSELIKCVSIIEMKHLELLAETIFKLGLVPMYRGTTSTSDRFWDGRFVDYRMDIVDMLNIDIESEKAAIRNYEQHIAIINDRHIQELLKRIILDEEKHIELFNKELSKHIKQASS